MENDAATLYCPNEACLAANPLTHKFCQRCSTPLPKRYLWVVGENLIVGSPGDILADRYLVISKSVVLDTKPGLLPHAPELDNSQGIKVYLRLIPYSLNVPQLYGVLPLVDGNSHKEILLLEKPPLYTNSSATQVQLCSQLTTAWRQGTSMRQLNWLWQIANLWQPLKSQGVATSLIDPHVLRVEGTLVRLLELRFDASTAPGLPQLGEFWQQLQAESQPAIAEFVRQLSNFLMQGEINSSEVLITVLDQALVELGRSQTPKIKIVTKTDTGPSRQRNEDACYPPSGTVVNKPPQASALAIVCDGIGGHEGGNVASNLAIETIQQQVQQLTTVPSEHIDPSLVLADLDQAVAIANDKISQRNDSENRHARQRMGTTLVMALPIGHEIYITHVGDSRAYWITRHGCYQVTLDDDVAAREVRLGYAIYREAIQQGGAGSLVQALGMSSSASLHPTSQRFVVDEDAIFLLTSDGLTDFDRVEDYWETEILPVLKGENDLVKVADRLVDIANTKNGHDNVTLALVHYQVKYVEPESTVKAVIPDVSAKPVASSVNKGLQPTLLESSPDQKTKVIPEKQPTKTARLPLALIVPLILAIASGGLGYWIMRMRSPSAIFPTITTSPTVPNPVPERSLNNLAPGWVIQTNSDIPLDNLSTFPAGSFWQVTEIQPLPQPGTGDSLVNLRLCSPTNTISAEVAQPPPAQIIERIELSQLKGFDVTVLQSNDDNPCNAE